MAKDPHALPELLDEFALVPRFEDRMEELATLAEPEDWEHKNPQSNKKKPVLSNYIKYTYTRLAEEKKIIISPDEEYACMNTGLVTRNQEPIFIIFKKNKLDNHKTYWHFGSIVRRGHWELNKIPSLPDIAQYFEDPSILVFDSRKEFRTNIEHIIETNKERFPVDLQSVPNYVLLNIVRGAIESAVERTRRNYKTAIPQYHNKTVQLLLPLSLTDPQKADLALAVEKYDTFYRASTCLTLDMAYTNARLLARPDRDWLQP